MIRRAIPASLVALLAAVGTAAACSDGAGKSAHAAQSGSCVPKGSTERGKFVTQARASRVVHRYARDTMSGCAGVEGMGVGARDGESQPDPKDKVHRIVVYLRDPASKPADTRSIAGVRIKYQVTGPIQAQ